MEGSATTSGVSFRAATKGDSHEIAELFRVSSDGVADYVWSTLASEYPGLTPIEIGARRYAGEEGSFSYKNCIVAERDGEVIGMLFTFPIEKRNEKSSEKPADPILEPYEKLEISGSLYICSLAVFAGFRGMGLGTKMLCIARDQACERGLGVLSLLVFERNAGAVRLYERAGFRVVDRAPGVSHDLIHYTGDVLLMAAEI